jgi:hypothetical protein
MIVYSEVHRKYDTEYMIKEEEKRGKEEDEKRKRR